VILNSTPIIATWLFATFHSSLPIALYILLLAIIGIIATSILNRAPTRERVGGNRLQPFRRR
jgi:membrane protein insertase Oxa1/YidC/SpoIIIJ